MTRRNRALITSALALSAVLTVSACSSGDTGEPTRTEQAPVEEASSAEATGTEATGESMGSTEDSEAAGSSGETAEAAEVEIGETFEDPDMGDTIEVLSAVRDFPSEEKPEVTAEGGEIVLVEVRIAPGDEYGGRISAGNFEISYDGGADYWNNQTRMIEEEMDAAGYPPLDDISRRDGGEHTGWIAFFPEEKQDTYLMQYTRDAAKVIGSDEKIDEFTADFEIPAP